MDNQAVQHIEYRNPKTDRSKWGPGEWDSEPDKVQFVDEVTGMPCLAVRNHGGAWCGYVGVNTEHPLHGKHYDDVDIDVHGALTFADTCGDYGSVYGICHVSDQEVWWFGFDCAHSGDMVPAHYFYRDRPEWFTLFEGDVYRNLAYVKDQCAKLAAQLADAERVLVTDHSGGHRG